ncbi:MAG TPA: hypothetical protein VK212_11370 [Lentimicrobium sp.]|nr:hypothetical protein [Lentimicrobium sp.]
MKNKIFYLTAFVALVLLKTGQAQDRISSPYSRYGLGEILQNTHVNNMAMGGINQGIYNPLFVNPANPASYTAFDSLSFVFDVSLHARFTNLSTTTLSQSANYASVGNLLFGFPVTSWWKASFGLLPYSASGYKMADTRTDTLFTSITNLYEGSGGLNQFYIGSSFDITRNFSVGANFAYLFGTLERSSAVEFPDSLHRLNSKILYTNRIHDFLFNYGVMYHKDTDRGFEYTIGASFTAQTNISNTSDNVTYTYRTISGIEIPRDTIEIAESVKDEITLPMGMAAGFSFGKINKWLIGSDFSYTQWEKFKFSASPEALKNNMQFSLGGYYNPSKSTVSGYLKRLTYRAGVRYSTGFLELRGQKIDDFGISFGVGLPLPRTSSTINLAFEVGSRGTKNENLISENYVKFTLGLSLFERWFIIKKYE